MMIVGRGMAATWSATCHVSQKCVTTAERVCRACWEVYFVRSTSDAIDEPHLERLTGGHGSSPHSFIDGQLSSLSCTRTAEHPGGG